MFILISALYCQSTLANKYLTSPTMATEKPEKVKLTKEEKEIIKKDKPIYKKRNINNSMQHVAIFKINAPKEIVCSTIKDFKKYPNWIDEVESVKVYKEHDSHLFATFELKHWLIGKWEYSIDHNFHLEEQGWGTWTLDKSMKSDISSSDGMYLLKIPKNEPNATIVTYGIQIKLKGVSNIVKNILQKNGVISATSWIKKQSEIRFLDKLAPRNGSENF